VRRFVLATLSFCRASLPERVAAFTVGREEIIPAMFTAALQELREREQLDGFIWYLCIWKPRGGTRVSRVQTGAVVQSKASFDALQKILKSRYRARRTKRQKAVGRAACFFVRHFRVSAIVFLTSA